MRSCPNYLALKQSGKSFLLVLRYMLSDVSLKEYLQAHESFAIYSVCKCEVKSIGKWSKVSVLLNQPYSNLVPRV
jgi:hypothetical protein